MIREIEWDLAPAAWRALAERCPRATIYHTPGWSLTQRDHGGYALHTVRFVFADGKQALLPLATRKRFRGLLREAVSGVEGGYGGLASTAPLSPDQVEEAFRRVRQRFGDLVVTGSPHEAFPNLPAGKLASADPTQIIPILQPQAQLAAMSETRRGSIRRAGREGYRSEVIVAPEPSQVARFFPIYEEHAEGWGSQRWRRDERYFQTLFHHAGRDLVLFLAWHGEELAGFRILGGFGRVAIAMHLSRARPYERRHVAPFMMGETLAWCHAHGHEAVDLLASGSLEGVRSYKASFGAVERPCPVVSHTSWVGASLETLWQAGRSWRRTA
jgi:hypothetical protein